MSYKEKIKEVIALSDFKVDGAIYKYYLVSDYKESSSHLQVIHCDNETTVITSPGNEHLLEIIETNNENWRLLKIRCGKPFYCVGFIAAISNALAEAGIDLTLTSTYEYDLVLVQEEKLESAIAVLVSIGFKQL